MTHKRRSHSKGPRAGWPLEVWYGALRLRSSAGEATHAGDQVASFKSRSGSGEAAEAAIAASLAAAVMLPASDPGQPARYGVDDGRDADPRDGSHAWTCRGPGVSEPGHGAYALPTAGIDAASRIGGRCGSSARRWPQPIRRAMCLSSA